MSFYRVNQAEQFQGLSIGKALDWVKRHKREVIGGAVIIGGVAMAAKTAGGVKALGTSAGWSKIGAALTGAGGRVVQAAKGVDVGKALTTTASVLSAATAYRGGAQVVPDPDAQAAAGSQGLVYGPQNPVQGGEAVVSVDGDVGAPSSGLPTWLPWALGGAAILGLVLLMGSGPKRIAVAA